MTPRFVRNRIAELERVCASMEEESADADSKGRSLQAEVALAVTQVRRGIQLLRDTLEYLDREELARHEATRR